MINSYPMINSLQVSSSDKYLYDIIFDAHQIFISNSKSDIKDKIKNSSYTFIFSNRSDVCYTNNFDNSIAYDLKKCTVKGVDFFE